LYSDRSHGLDPQLVGPEYEQSGVDLVASLDRYAAVFADYKVRLQRNWLLSSRNHDTSLTASVAKSVRAQ
jgi:hypothetical protein